MEEVTLRQLKLGIQLQLQVKLNKNLCTVKRKKRPLGWVIKQLSQTFLGNSENFRPLGAVDDLMHYRPRPRGLRR